MEFKRHTRQKRRTRRAAAAIELAICLPLLFTIIFGSIEACNLIFLKQAVTAAAYEGALVAMRPHVEETEVTDRVNDILSARQITGTTITITVPGLDFDDLWHGDQFTLTIQVPTAGNIPDPRLFGFPEEVSASITAEKQ